MPSPISGSIEVGQLVNRMMGEIMAAADDATDHTAALGERMAKRLAPRRKVSYIDRNRITRPLSRAEVARLPAGIREGAQAIQRGGGRVLTTTRQARQSRPAPALVERDGRFELANPDDARDITYRGRQELAESGRRPARAEVDLKTGKISFKPGTSAVYSRRMTSVNRRFNVSHGERHTLGGRLKGEITAIKVEQGSARGRIRYDILSPTSYARFVEFPTSRTAAQPYLRPTLKALRAPFRAALLREFRRRGFRTI